MDWFRLILTVILLAVITLQYRECLKMQRDRNRWRFEANAALGHVNELEQAIRDRCVHYDHKFTWCKHMDQLARCAACFVRNEGYEEAADG